MKEGRVSFSLDIVRDDVFVSKVSSNILSYPRHSSSKSSTESGSKTLFEKENLVASAGVLHGDSSESDVGSVGYIAIAEFTQRTLVEVESALENIKAQLTSAATERQHREDAIKGRSVNSILTGSVSDSISISDVGGKCRLDALIIDLRGNLGGTLPSALDAASLFLPHGKVLLRMKSIASPNSMTNTVLDPTGINQVENNGRTEHPESVPRSRRRQGGMSPLRSIAGFLHRKERTQSYYSTHRDADTSTSLLLLVDSQTASASEIFAAALIDNNRATCMGCRTVGKNVAQVCI